MRLHTVRAAASAVALSFVFAASAFPSVIVVDQNSGPGTDFTDIQPAVNAAFSGDVILVRDGDYTPFGVYGKSLQIMADSGASVTVTAAGASPAIDIDALGGSENVTLRGIEVPGAQSGTGMRIANGVNCWLEEVQVDGFSPSLDVQSATVNMQLSSFSGASGDVLVAPGGPGMVVFSSTIAAVYCQFIGGTGFAGPSAGTAGGDGGPGATFAGGSMIATGCLFQGGEGGAGFDDFVNCSPGGNGSNGLELTQFAPTVTLVDTEVYEGAGGQGGKGSGTPCPDGFDGISILISSGSVATDAGPTRSFNAKSPVRAGQSAFMKVNGEFGDTALLFVGTTPVALGAPSFSGALQVAPLLVLPFVSSGGVNVPLPNLPAGIESASVFLQPAFIDAQGGAHLHQASALTILDASF